MCLLAGSFAEPVSDSTPFRGPVTVGCSTPGPLKVFPALRLLFGFPVREFRFCQTVCLRLGDPRRVSAFAKLQTYYQSGQGSHAHSLTAPFGVMVSSRCGVRDSRSDFRFESDLKC